MKIDLTGFKMEQRSDGWYALRDGQWVKCHELPNGAIEAPIQIAGLESGSYFVGLAPVDLDVGVMGVYTNDHERDCRGNTRPTSAENP